MRISPHQKRNIIKITTFSLFSLGFGLMYALLEKGLMGDARFYPSTNNAYEFKSALISISIGSLALGAILGVFEVYILNHSFKRRKFATKILFKTILYIFVIAFFLGMIGLFTNAQRMGMSPSNPEVIASIINFYTNFVFLSILIYVGAMVAISIFIIEISDVIGISVFKNFLIGKYHHPIEEERVFMFLDMKSSTTIAERLGNKKYYELLNQYYSDINEIILNSLGEIYQYVGDEVVVSWTLEKAVDGMNCLRCFFLVKQRFRQKEKFYMDQFGELPDFRAGFHFGQVTTGEVGIIKREILFTGDVLNTTARIQSACKEYQVDILFSDVLLKQLTIDEHYKLDEVASTVLRGRKAPIKLFTISEA